jgi:uncharacterized protein
MKTYAAFFVVAALLVAVASGTAGAQQSHQSQGLPVLQPAMPQVDGAVSWDALGKAKPVKVKNKLSTEFPDDVMALNRRDVKLVGFMMPLAPGDKQTHFLMSYSPQTCAFCMPSGPEGMVEVKTKTPVKVTFEPLVMSGKFEVLADDPGGVYYRLIDAGQVKP